MQKTSDFLDTLNRSEKTVRTYRYALNRFCEIVGNDAPLDADTFTKFLRKIKNLSPSTQRVYRTAVLSYYNFCRAGNPQELQEVVRHYSKRSGVRIPTFDRDAIEKVITYCDGLRGNLPNLRDRAFVLTLADTGLRTHEACKLKRGDIDWKEYVAVVIGKGDKQAVVRFSKRSINALKDYLSARAKLDGATGKPLMALPLFARHDMSASKTTKPVKSCGMWYAVKDRMTEAGVDRSTVRIHDFRHYFVSTVYAATRDIKQTKELARHGKITTTEGYTHLIGDLDEVYDSVFNRQ